MVSQQVLFFIGQVAPQHLQAAITFLGSLPFGWQGQLPLCARQFGWGTLPFPPFQISLIAQAVLYITSNSIVQPSSSVKIIAHKLLLIQQSSINQFTLF